MLIIISPAKSMDMTPPEEYLPATTPRYAEEAEFLAGKMAVYNEAELSGLFGISPALAELNRERYEELAHGDAPAKQALFAYTGNVFKEIAPLSLAEGDLEYAQEHLRIVSAFYGIVQPYDMIRAHRLEFPLKIKGVQGTLWDFWRDKLTEDLIEEAGKQDGIVVNLASDEITKVFDPKRLNGRLRVIRIGFKEDRDGSFKTIRAFVKKARGAMVRHIVTRRIDRPEELKNFRWNGYGLNKALSDERNYIFTREQVL